MDLIIQYIIIAVVFVVALVYIAKRFMPAKKNKGGCAKGCGCAVNDSSAPRS
ncbi:FeoB-associated Cys-rich membrane protein [Sphingobacterium paludis]|jgi:hypothetical protein|uniref:FeoB-associated Cys-rich membrane protein n=1 Tax=Sphingobacterium paludis TaxID=1476465 RepID=UPI001AAF7DE8